MKSAVSISIRCTAWLTLIALSVSVGGAQNSKVTSRQTHKKHAPPPPLITDTAPQPAPPPEPPPVQTLEQMPPRVPDVVWDGKLLSISSENSTLSDILTMIRTRTGAAIDVPAGSGRERVAARLGPGPVREVLTSLLSGTDYDYIIQASETDEYGIQNVTLTPRGKGEDFVTSSTAAARGIRRAPRFTASGKHTFEVMPDANTIKDDKEKESQDVASTDEGQTTQPAETGAPESASADAQPAPADPQPETESGSNSSGSLAGSASSDTPQVGRGALPGIDPNSPQPPTLGQMVQGMQQLFEQRRQLQIQQNQAQQKTPPTN